jgi:hypothetical protein
MEASMKVSQIVTAGAAAWAACAVLGAVPAPVQANSASAAAWTKQAPAVHPPGRQGAAMAYDAATGTAMLFGGFNGRISPYYLSDTWTWNGTTWTKQHPVVHPSARDVAAMVYDAATASVVLFGGGAPNGGVFGDTWTWG